MNKQAQIKTKTEISAGEAILRALKSNGAGTSNVTWTAKV